MPDDVSLKHEEPVDPLARRAAMVVLATALVVLLGGWGAGLDALVRLHPSFPAMVPTTAVGLAVLSGGTLWWQGAGGRGRFLPVQLAASVMAAMVLVNLTLIITRHSSGLDAVLGVVGPGDYMAPGTGLGLALGAYCLFELPAERGWRVWVRSALATAGLLSASIALVGYLFDADALRGVFVFSAMALHTAAGLFLGFLTLLLTRPSRWMRTLRAPQRGSMAARRLLPVFIIGPLLLNYMALEATRGGLLDPNLRLGLLSVVTIMILVGAAVVTAEVENRLAARLDETMGALRTAVDDKDVLLRELHHRVGNDMQMIRAFMKLESVRVQDGAVKDAFQALERRVAALAMVHQLLLTSRSPSRVDMSRFLDQLCQSINEANDLAGRDITLEASAREVVLSMDAAIPMGLLTNELVTNAIKYAFPGGRAGTIRVTHVGAEDGSCILTVADDGQGLGEEAHGGTGTSIVRALVDQLDGELTVDGSHGTTVTITVPPRQGATARQEI